jgi:hypothetical protein
MLQEFAIESILALLAAARVLFRGRTDLALEVLALRQQVPVGRFGVLMDAQALR